MSRLLSYTEISTALTCHAQHAFAYTGRLSDGKTLKPRQLSRWLSDGSAWGAGMAVWHGYPRDESIFSFWEPGRARIEALAAVRASYAQDIEQQKQLGFGINIDTELERVAQVSAMMEHYMNTAPRLGNLTRIEAEIDVPIPSRGGKRGSNKYRFHCFLDGYTIEDDEGQWIVEFKLRDSLQSPKLIQKSRQPRWYAWALRQMQGGKGPVGVYVDERLNRAPDMPKIVNAKRKSEGINGKAPSHDKGQFVRPEDYIALCEEYNVKSSEDALSAFAARQWQQRVPIQFRPSELDEAGEELVSAARLIRDLDSGTVYPIRNAQPRLCNSCKFESICDDPHDEGYIETLFELTQPKRLRPPREETSGIPTPA